MLRLSSAPAVARVRHQCSTFQPNETNRLREAVFEEKNKSVKQNQTGKLSQKGQLNPLYL
jgi:hypothetical protein